MKKLLTLFAIALVVVVSSCSKFRPMGAFVRDTSSIF